MQPAVAVKFWVPLTVTVGVDGATVTEVRIELEVIVTGATACLEIPFNVAFTVRDTAPSVGPAAKVVVAPVVGFTDPSELFKDHA